MRCKRVSVTGPAPVGDPGREQQSTYNRTQSCSVDYVEVHVYWCFMDEAVLRTTSTKNVPGSVPITADVTADRGCALNFPY